MHFAGTLPSPNGRERIASTRCYAPASGEYNSRAYAAMPDRPMTHRGSISSAKPPFGYARGSMLVPTVPRQSLSARCGGGRRRDERAGTLARAAYWGAREGHRCAPPTWSTGGASARAVRWVRRRIDVQPAGGAGAIGCWLATRRSVVTARTRACGCNSDAHMHRRTVRPPDAPELLQVCTSGRSRQLRARRPLSAEAFGHGPSRARGNAVGCGRYRLQGQLRCKSTNEPVHSNIFPLRY